MCVSAPSAPAPAPAPAPVAAPVDPNIALDAKKKQNKLRFNRARSGSLAGGDSLLNTGALGPAS